MPLALRRFLIFSLNIFKTSFADLYYTPKEPLHQATNVNIAVFEPFFYEKALAPKRNEGKF